MAKVRLALRSTPSSSRIRRFNNSTHIKMMIQATTALVIVCLALAQADVPCTAETCTSGACRLVQTTDAAGITSTAPHCLPCAPDLDDTCILSNFWRAVLTGDETSPATMTALACGEMCPEGATCVEGVCCYGDNPDSVSNSDPICVS